MYINKIFLKRNNDFFLSYLYPINFINPITILYGENGIGKSTILESLAVYLGCPAEGGSKNFKFTTEDTHINIPDLVVDKGARMPKDIFFYRSETFYTFMSEMKRLDMVEMGGAKISSYYGGNELHKLSHGEAMRALYLKRFRKNGLYLLDEPEVSLSINNQLEFMERVIDLSKNGSQFIIATHSPVLMQIPGSDLLEITKRGVKSINFKETNVYYIYRELMSEKHHDYLSSILHMSI